MKASLGAWVAALALGASALTLDAAAQATGEQPAATSQPSAPAQSAPPSRCPGFPADPSLPDGATARNARVMQDGDRVYQEWGRSMQSVLECRRTEAQEAQAAAVLANATAQQRVTEYNAAVERLNVVGQAWQAEAAEYNGRNRR